MRLSRGVLVITTLASLSDCRQHVILARSVKPVAAATLSAVDTQPAVNREASIQLWLASQCINEVYAGHREEPPLRVIHLSGR